eukprot:gnl/MRDRNA2_/MRDRNA2_31265_c0_seq1.p1 gnl/MRDRNA2_/MRDRNA2_31265_c0~~gnl/MRDRNA2_/MRDRNA2_31265_c0_seq1.p1  ORF type:complete len:240 (+),score=47.26 gnl/MRDRNA2_/MRDRNA2_31265_c0_seq1:1-720(+)
MVDAKIPIAVLICAAVGGYWFATKTPSSAASQSTTTATTNGAPKSEPRELEQVTGQGGTPPSSTPQQKPKSTQDPEKTVNATQCKTWGFDSALLSCSTCDNLKQRLLDVGEEKSIEPPIVTECLGCCQNPKDEKFEAAVLIAPASAQERDQDLHDFVKRKAPLFPGLEVEYQEGDRAAIEFSNPSKDPERVVRIRVHGWKSEHLFSYLSLRLENSDQGQQGLGQGERKYWTAEIQTCSG